MELPTLSGLAAKVLYRKVSQRLESLTEVEVLKWRAGAWRIADEVIERYSDRLTANRSFILASMDAIDPEEVSRELTRRRPDLGMYWVDEVFFQRLEEEKGIVKTFLLGNAPPPGPSA